MLTQPLHARPSHYAPAPKPCCYTHPPTHPPTIHAHTFSLGLAYPIPCVITILSVRPTFVFRSLASPAPYKSPPLLQVEALDPREIAAFTQDAGYKTSFIPAGTLFLPPEDNVDPSDRPWRPDGSFPDPVAPPPASRLPPPASFLPPPASRLPLPASFLPPPASRLPPPAAIRFCLFRPVSLQFARLIAAREVSRG